LEVWHRPVYGPKASPSRFRVALRRFDGFACRSPLHAWTGTSSTRRCLAFSVPPSLVTPPRRNRNIHLLPFAYASRPPLRNRLTLGGLTFPRNPWAFGAQVFHLRSRYSCRHSLFRLVQPSLRSAFNLSRNAPLPLDGLPRQARSVGDELEPR
jgi:hypothetical protein